MLKAHRPLYHSTLGSRKMKKKKEFPGGGAGVRMHLAHHCNPSLFSDEPCLQQRRCHTVDFGGSISRIFEGHVTKLAPQKTTKLIA